ncbi:MAG: nuclease [Rhizobiales bacterium]|nr:nuclease [Hyphomicrobiales bacterium]
MHTVQVAPIYLGVFISHSWAYSGHYDKLAEWFFLERWNHQGRPVVFKDYSVPKDNPIHFASNDTQLYAAISAKISASDVAVIPTGMYSSYSKWIGKEIQAAQALKKPILAVNPWGQERKSSVVVQNATRAVGWNKKSVIDNAWGLFINE